LGQRFVDGVFYTEETVILIKKEEDVEIDKHGRQWY